MKAENGGVEEVKVADAGNVIESRVLDSGERGADKRPLTRGFLTWIIYFVLVFTSLTLTDWLNYEHIPKGTSANDYDKQSR